MRKFFIFSTLGLYDHINKRFSIGGVQTYMRDLAKLSQRIGYIPIIIEMNNVNNKEQFVVEDIYIKQVSSRERNWHQACFDKIYRENNKPENIFVISTDQLDIKCRQNNVIAINHGIAFDEPMLGRRFGKIIKLGKCLKNIWRGNLCNNLVCVDYNFYNWYRTLDTFDSNRKIRVIPNYSQGNLSKEQLDTKLKQSKRRKIIFSRRFVDYRGTIIFANAVSKLLKEYIDLDVTFAGKGPLFSFVESKFSSEPRVHITSYRPEESLHFHSQFDIAIVPTLYSEGTSLSLIEAMAAGCFPIATHVGGMTNILIDGYNGVLCFPSENAVYVALKRALDSSKQDFGEIVTNSWYTATKGFSKEKWEKRWSEYILSLSGKFKYEVS